MPMYLTVCQRYKDESCYASRHHTTKLPPQAGAKELFTVAGDDPKMLDSKAKEMARLMGLEPVENLEDASVAK